MGGNKRKDDKFFYDLQEVLDKYFPKGGLKDRGRAEGLALFSQAVVQHETRLGTLPARDVKEEVPSEQSEISAQLWALDNGQTYSFFERRKSRVFKTIKKGTRIYPSPMWRFGNTDGHSYTLVGYGRDDRTIRVLKKGNKTPSTYWVGFWQLWEINRK